ncbi:MAG: hypothetical protein KBS76_03085 [Ruminococcus sp.]|nr:hypothetical protein [Candidatus Apopatosoma intestinale]
MKITAKFGGTSLCDARAMEKAARIVTENGDRKYIVVSAPGKRFPDDDKITDLLYRAYEDGNYSPVFDRFAGIAHDLGLDPDLDEAFREIERETPVRGKDYLASRGEYLCARLFSDYIGFPFLDAADGIRFFPDGMPDIPETAKTLRALLAPYSRAVLPGFYGSDGHSTVFTFSRGGSDITGALVAAATDSDLYENWTDVDGVLSADPKIIDNPVFLDIITYDELRALSAYGATVLHEEAIAPARDAGIPIRIGHTGKPEKPGTLVVPARDVPIPFVGLSAKSGFAVVCLVGSRPAELAEKAGEALRAIGETDVPVCIREEDHACFLCVEEEKKSECLRRIYAGLTEEKHEKKRTKENENAC